MLNCTFPLVFLPSGTCVVEGDPHYHTFDKQLHHFMGTCTYTLSKLCESNSSLPYFNVEAANEHRGGNTRVSYVQYVDVDVAGQRIRLGKGGRVTVSRRGRGGGAVQEERAVPNGLLQPCLGFCPSRSMEWQRSCPAPHPWACRSRPAGSTLWSRQTLA